MQVAKLQKWNADLSRCVGIPAHRVHCHTKGTCWIIQLRER